MKNTMKSVLLSLVVTAFALPAFACGEKGSHHMRMDTNGDGQIEASEYAVGSKARFDRMDANHDGALSRDEMKTMHKKMKDHKQKHKKNDCEGSHK